MNCENCKSIDNLVNKFKNKEINKIELLQKTQELYGYLPEKVCFELAEKTGVSISELYSIITFYAQFKLNPPAKWNIEVCTGTACYVNGAEEIVNRVKLITKVNDKGFSDDGNFFLNTARCIGCCSLAPVMTINGKVFGNLKVDMIEKIITENCK